jgi:hypothetical protein
MPDGLNDTYVRILKDISKRDVHQRSIAFTCFRWMVAAERTLYWSELEVALALADPNCLTLEESLADTLPQTYVLSACGNLIHCFREKQLRSDDSVAFVHSSVIQFLSSNLQKFGLEDQIWSTLSDKSNMDLQAACDCIRYITYCVEPLDTDPYPELEDTLTSKPFAKYAFTYFDKHAVASMRDGVSARQLDSAIEQLLGRDEVFLGWCFDIRCVVKADANPLQRSIPFLYSVKDRNQLIWTTELYAMLKESASLMPSDNTLHLLAVNGYLEPLQDLTSFIDDGWVDIDAVDEYGCSALYYACAYEQISVVEFLLCNGAHPQRGFVDADCTRLVSSVDRHIPLCAAIRTGHVPIVERLLTAYVEAKILDSSPEALDYPLRLAVQSKQATITKLLTAHGAIILSSSEDTPDAVAGAIRE